MEGKEKEKEKEKEKREWEIKRKRKRKRLNKNMAASMTYALFWATAAKTTISRRMQETHPRYRQ